MNYKKIFLLIILALGCSQKNKNEFQPFEELNGLKFVQKISGKEAQAMIDKLHGKSVTPEENSIIFYKGDNGEAVLYVSKYSNATIAKDAYDKMAMLIRDGNDVFGHFHEFNIDNQQLSMCLGMGQAHYFFSNDIHLYWLSANYQIAQSTVVDLINKLKNE